MMCVCRSFELTPAPTMSCIILRTFVQPMLKGTHFALGVLEFAIDVMCYDALGQSVWHDLC